MKRSLLPLLIVPLLFVVGCINSISPDLITNSRDARNQGVRLLADKDYAHAVGAFRNAVRQEPRDYKSYYYLGVCYEELHQYQLAIESYKTAVAINTPEEEGQPLVLRPQMIDALARAIASYDDRDTELNALEAAAPGKGAKASETYMLLARIYRYRKDPDSALRAYQQAVIHGSNDFAIYKEYGLYLLDNLQMPKEAEVPLRRAYTLNQGDDQINNALRRINIIPGPGLKEQHELAKPIIPKGPIPEVNVSKLFNQDQPQPKSQPQPQAQPQRPVTPTGAPTPGASAPRD